MAAVTSGDGSDTISTDSRDDRVVAGGGNDQVRVPARARGIHRVDSGSGSDTISGNAGTDLFDGGDDILHGGLDLGFDTTNGGSGNDVCRTTERAVSCEDLA